MLHHLQLHSALFSSPSISSYINAPYHHGIQLSTANILSCRHAHVHKGGNEQSIPRRLVCSWCHRIALHLKASCHQGRGAGQQRYHFMAALTPAAVASPLVDHCTIVTNRRPAANTPKVINPYIKNGLVHPSCPVDVEKPAAMIHDPIRPATPSFFYYIIPRIFYHS